MSKRKENITTLVEMIVLIALISAVLLALNIHGPMDLMKPENSVQKTLFFIGLVPVMLFAIAFHELGHLVAGLVQGFEFQLFVVGPLGVKKEEGKVKWYFNKDINYFGGVAATSPVNDHPDNAKKLARLVLAGPLASLALAVIGYAIMWYLPKPLSLLVLTTSMVSIALFFATTVPTKTGMFFTDRKRYQRLVTPGKSQDVELAQLRIMGNYSANNSYKNVSEDDIRMVITDDAPFVKYFGYFNLLCYKIENELVYDEAVKADLEAIGKSMPASIVKVFNAEIDKIRAKMGV